MSKPSSPDEDAIDLLLELSEVYILCIIREAIAVSARDPNRAPSTVAARRVLVKTIIDLAKEGRLG